jgi:8-oxo-dGTP diphosphatase
MLKRIIGKIWRVTPSSIREFGVRISQKKFTVSVGAIVVNDEGKVLLLDHVFRPSSAGWGIPGGFINHNEQPAAAIQREICEEIGLEIKSIELLQVRAIKRHVEILFRARATGAGAVKSLEIKEIGWFAPDQMPPVIGGRLKQTIKEILAAEAEPGPAPADAVN